MSETAPASNFELKTLRQVLDEGVPLARQNLRLLYWPIALPVVVIMTITGVMQASLMARFMPLAGEEQPDMASLLGLMSMGMGAFALALLTMAVMAVGFTALTVAVMDILAGQQPDMKRAWRTAATPGMLWTTALTVIFSILSLLLCLLPAVWVIPLLTLALPVAAAEGERGMGAVSRGAALLRTRPGSPASERPRVRSLVILLVMVAMAQALTWVGQGPLLILQQILLARDMATGGAGVISGVTVWLQVPLSLIGALTQVLAWIYAAFTLGVHYHDVVNRRQGDDLRREIDRWESRGADAEAPAPPPSQETWEPSA